MKTAFIVLSLSLLVACSPADDRARDTSGRLELTPTEACVNGVVYYKSLVHMGYTYAPKFNPDSTVETCN